MRFYNANVKDISYIFVFGLFNGHGNGSYSFS